MKSVLVGATAIVLSLTGCAATEEPPPLSPAELVPVLTQPQEPFDVIPVATPEDIDPGSTRFLGSADGVKWWLGVPYDEIDGSTCLIATDFDDIDGNFTYDCMTRRMLYYLGTRISVQDAEDGFGVYLMPNDVDVTPLEQYLGSAVSPLVRPEGMPAARAMAQDRVTLIPFRPQDVKEGTVTLQRSSGEPIIFNVA